jgi:hypothetical protein
MWTTPSGDSCFNDHPFGTFDAWSGRRPPHQSRRFDSLGEDFRSTPINGHHQIGPACLKGARKKLLRCNKISRCDLVK